MLLHWEILRELLARLTVQQYTSLQEFFNFTDEEVQQRLPPQPADAQVLPQPEYTPPSRVDDNADRKDDDTTVLPHLESAPLSPAQDTSEKENEDEDPDNWLVVDEASTLPAAYDSHFHLDRLQEALGMGEDSTLDAIHARLHPVEAYDVDVTGSVANLCDPTTYPDAQTIASLREQVSGVPSESIPSTLGGLRRLPSRPSKS